MGSDFIVVVTPQAPTLQLARMRAFGALQGKVLTELFFALKIGDPCEALPEEMGYGPGITFDGISGLCNWQTFGNAPGGILSQTTRDAKACLVVGDSGGEDRHESDGSTEARSIYHLITRD
jgi:hypothetical protein